jgi:M6 family metalloprotease-like protein
MSRALAFVVVLLLASAARADFADHFARQTDVPFDKIPSRGHSRVFLLPVEVAGHPLFDVAALRTFFGPGPGSFSAYYATASQGKLQVEVEVLDPVHYDTCPLPAAQFPDCAVSRGDTASLTPAMNVLRDALSRAHARGTDFRRYDLNGALGTPDGTVDGFMLLTNIPFGGIALPIFELNAGDNLAGGTGGPFILDGVKIPYVAVAADQNVLLHEFGHLLGFTDLYDENDARGGLDLSLMGNWGYRTAPPLLDAESRYRIGWAHVEDVTKSDTFWLGPAEQGGVVLKLGDGPEYLLLENRGPSSGLDGQLSRRGIAVYHVDRRAGPTGDQGGFVARLLKCVECDLYHPYVLNEVPSGPFRWQTTGRFDWTQELFAPGQSLAADPSGLPFSESHAVASTNHLDGTPTGFTVSVLGELGQGLMVRVETGGTGSCAPPPACPEGSVCPDEACAPPPTAPRGGCGSGSLQPLAMLAMLLLLLPRGHFLPKSASKAALAASASLAPSLGPEVSKSK